jgi:hypothetical protein
MRLRRSIFVAVAGFNDIRDFAYAGRDWRGVPYCRPRSEVRTAFYPFRRTALARGGRLREDNRDTKARRNTIRR